MKLRIVLFPLVIVLMFAIGALTKLFAFNPITDVRDNLKWTFGQVASAGEGYNLSSKEWDASVLAEVAQYRFLSFSYGGTELDHATKDVTDTFKVGFLSSFFFKLFVSQPTPAMSWMTQLNIGPSYAIPVFSGSTGHKGVFLIDGNFRFGAN